MSENRDGPGPKGGCCPRCTREVGALTVHLRHCTGETPDPNGLIPHLPTKRYGITHPTSYPAPLVGGPMHGWVVPPARGRRPGYLDGEGHTVPLRSAERFMNRVGRSQRSGMYVLRQVYPLNHYWYLWISRP
jgi:hypothetical protein